MKTVKGWWFTTTDNKLPNGDNRQIRIGRTHKVKGEIIPCKHGLHLSKTPLDALTYAPGPVIYKVQGSGVIIPHGDPIDKYVCSERTYIEGGINITNTLRKFARMCALDVIHLWDAPNIVIKYLKSGNKDIRAAANDATWTATSDETWADTARAAAWAATAGAETWTAAWAAAWAATCDETWAAPARAETWAAARDATWAETWAATARDKQSIRLTRMILNHIRKEK